MCIPKKIEEASEHGNQLRYLILESVQTTTAAANKQCHFA